MENTIWKSRYVDQVFEVRKFGNRDAVKVDRFPFKKVYDLSNFVTSTGHLFKTDDFQIDPNC